MRAFFCLLFVKTSILIISCSFRPLSSFPSPNCCSTTNSICFGRPREERGEALLC